ncbi:MAG TPA: hypothetical protein VN441_05250 [Syntrophomonas sp.]|nr:hypothetical protein [Syntrophomonas sp.]
MQRGSVIIYDNNGKIWYNSGDAEGDILPNAVPDGLPYIETAFGELAEKRVLSVDVATGTLVTEDIEVAPTYEELQQELLIAQGVI